MPDELESLWPCHQLIFSGHVTWTELSTIMSLDDAQLLGMSINHVDDLRSAHERDKKLKKSAESMESEKKLPRRHRQNEGKSL